MKASLILLLVLMGCDRIEFQVKESPRKTTLYDQTTLDNHCQIAIVKGMDCLICHKGFSSGVSCDWANRKKEVQGE